MICKSCGAEFDENEEKCPFCGATSEKGAKRTFHKKLDQITDDIEDMSKKPKIVLVKKTAVALIVATAVLIISVLIIVIVKDQARRKQLREDEEYEQQLSQRIAWENEVFPMLDKWYEQEDFASILAYEMDLLHQENDYGIYHWRHYSFIEIYQKYDDILKYINTAEEPVDDYVKGEALIAGMELIYDCTEEALKNYIPEDIDHSTWGLTRDELVLIEGYRLEAEQMMSNLFHMTTKEQDKLHDSCIKDGYVRACYDYIKGLE